MNYWTDPRYLKLRGKTRLITKFPDEDPVHFADGRDEIVGHGFLTPSEYEQMLALMRPYWTALLARLDAEWPEQAELVRSRVADWL